MQCGIGRGPTAPNLLCARGTIERLFGFTAQSSRDPFRGVNLDTRHRRATAHSRRRQRGYGRLGQQANTGKQAKKPRPDQAKDQQMGSALRSVYQKTVDEKVPDDLLDLLGKLS